MMVRERIKADLRSFLVEYRCKAARMVAIACDIRNDASLQPPRAAWELMCGPRIHEYML